LSAPLKLTGVISNTGITFSAADVSFLLVVGHHVNAQVSLNMGPIPTMSLIHLYPHSKPFDLALACYNLCLLGSALIDYKDVTHSRILFVSV
jgi:hypothetical protein